MAKRKKRPSVHDDPGMSRIAEPLNPFLTRDDLDIADVRARLRNELNNRFANKAEEVRGELQRRYLDRKPPIGVNSPEEVASWLRAGVTGVIGTWNRDRQAHVDFDTGILEGMSLVHQWLQDMTAERLSGRSHRVTLRTWFYFLEIPQKEVQVDSPNNEVQIANAYRRSIVNHLALGNTDRNLLNQVRLG